MHGILKTVASCLVMQIYATNRVSTSKRKAAIVQRSNKKEINFSRSWVASKAQSVISKSTHTLWLIETARPKHQRLKYNQFKLTVLISKRKTNLASLVTPASTAAALRSVSLSLSSITICTLIKLD